MFKLLRPADIISMLNGLFGLSAILILIIDFSLSLQFKFHFAFTLILLGLLADGLDGIFARRFGKGELGDFFEAMSDMTTMGIAPCVFIAMRWMLYSYQSLILVFMLCLVLICYVCCAFIRLASFHPLKNKRVFIGLPASAATMFIMSISFLTTMSTSFITTNYIIFLFSVLFAAIFMVLPLSFPKPSKPMNIITIIIIILIIILGFNFQIIYAFLLISVLIYMFGGHIYVHFSKKMNKK